MIYYNYIDMLSIATSLKKKEETGNRYLQCCISSVAFTGVAAVPMQAR